MGNLITKTTELAMTIVSEYVKPGDAVIDATTGNGHDTAALAKLVGPSGKVYAFDIQETAIENTRHLLQKEGMESHCRLIHQSHDQMEMWIEREDAGKIAAVVFNLGYLPSADKCITTTVEETLSAVEQALKMIKKDGIVAVTMYGGHEEGAKEKAALLEYGGDLSEKQYHVVYVNMLNQKKKPPELLLITKKVLSFF